MHHQGDSRVHWSSYIVLCGGGSGGDDGLMAVVEVVARVCALVI
jgi:hypothetical protein